MLALFLISLSFAQSNGVAFTSDIRGGEAHSVAWSFAKEQSNWKTSAAELVTNKCDNPHTFTANWTNSRTLKVDIAPSLLPGEKCQFSLKDKTYSLQAPLAKVVEFRPWYFDNFHEDTPIAVYVDQPIDPVRLAAHTYLEVQGLEEKVEFNVLTDKELIEKLNKEVHHEGKHWYWLRPRRVLPAGKKFALHITQDQSFALKREGQVREEFLATVNCERTQADGPCNPLGRATLSFNANVPMKDLLKVRLVVAGKEFAPSGADGTDQVGRHMNFPAVLVPEAKTEIRLPSGLVDEEGRSLANASKFPLQLRVGEFPPLAKLSGAFGILEAEKEVMMPVTIRNTDRPLKIQFNQTRWGSMGAANLIKWQTAINKRQYQGWEKDLRGTSIFAGTNIPLTKKELTPKLSAKEMEIIGLPLPGKGLHIVEVESPKVGQSLLQGGQNFYISSLVLVTNMAIHTKIGSESALVWVTSMDKGEPVPQVAITIANCQGATLATATTDKDGMAIIPKLTEKQRNCTNSEASIYSEVMILAKSKDDFSFAWSNWSQGLEPWRFSVSRSYREDLLSFHTIFDRPIYQQLQTVSGLIIARDHNDSGLILPVRALSKKVEIKHQETAKTWTVTVTWNDLKAGAFTFKIPAEAPMGTYDLAFIEKNAKGQITFHKNAGNFKVEAYKVPLMALRLAWQDQRDNFTAQDPATVSGNLHYLSGPPAAEQKLSVRGMLRPGYGLTFKDFENFNFAVGDIGMLDASEPSVTLPKIETKTNKAGLFSYKPTGLKSQSYLQYLNLEVEYMDPNGMLQSQTINAKVVPAFYVVGVKEPKRPNIKQKTQYSFAVADLKGRAIKGAEVEVEIFSRKYYSVRKKIVGGFYAYDSNYKNESLGEMCEGKTNAQGLLNCSYQFKEAGEKLVQATVKDKDGNRSVSYMSVYLDGDEWRPVEASDRADLIADKKEYLVGETATFDLKLPFDAPWVLFTRERDNVLSHQVMRFTKGQSTIKLALKDSDSPNQFVSAIAVRGRVAAAPPSGMIDLGKPALRMGLTEVKVQRPETKLAVKVDVPTPVVKVRDTVKAKINVTRTTASALGKTKVAIAVIDAGLLELAPHTSMQLEYAFARQFGHGVESSTSTGLIVGRRHFGLKAKPSGGDGGSRPARELFDTLLYWNPAVTIDAKGNAEISFKANDSLTEFKVFAVAYSESLFGTGTASFKVTQDLLTFASLSPTLRVGDQTQSNFTLQNTTNQTMGLKASYRQEFDGKVVNSDKDVSLESMSAQVVSFTNAELKLPGTLHHNLKLSKNGKVEDQLITSQKVLPLYMPFVTASDFYEVNNKIEIPAPGKKGNESHIQLFFTASLLGSREALKEWMDDYAYHCLEQETARLVIGRDKGFFVKYRNMLPVHQDNDGLFRYYPESSMKGSAFLTAHVVEMMFWTNLKMDASVMDKAEAALMRVAKGELGIESYMSPEYREQLRLKSLATLMLVNSKHAQTQYLNNYRPDSAKDTLADLLDKWTLFAASKRISERDAVLQDLARRFEVSSAKMELKVRPEDENFWMLRTPVSQFARFLLLAKKYGLSADLDAVFKGQEAKWLRGFATLKENGHYGETLSNSYAVLVHDQYGTKAPTGKTVVNGQQSYTWPGNHDSIVIKDEAMFSPVKVQHQGQGTPYVDVQYFNYLDPQKTYEQGFAVSKSISFLEGQSPKIGQRMHFNYQVTAKQNSTLVAMRLPVPSGVSILQVEVEGGALQFQERDFTEARLYFAELPAGKTVKVKLTVRPNQAGRFGFPGARVEEMYAAQVFGKSPDEVMVVE